MTLGPKNSRECATAVLSDKGQGRSLPTDLEALIRGERVELEYFDSPQDFDGRLELCSGMPAIFVNARSKGRDDGRTRFTLAHEIGHFFLHGRLLRRGVTFRDARVEPSEEVDDARESEANAFASEVLFPTPLLGGYRNKLIGLEDIVGLASSAQASLQAAAIRLASISRDRFCFFLERKGHLKWCAPTEDWRVAGLPCKALVKRPVPKGAWAAKIAGDFSEKAVDLSSWHPPLAFRDESLFESAANTPYGRLILLGAESNDI